MKLLTFYSVYEYCIEAYTCVTFEVFDTVNIEAINAYNKGNEAAEE
jgi:hypothetical protein